ncbi:PREDICTED: arylsulfatase J-like [Acropora digitifera]|uniref:arylsulfatase J-like n=1 Tax=Acropora digitifera TaxID=70779 RepID=UPI00077A24AF|nr:PREDICTED: arylsulfatase J-like [Acropora digitifera]XP_015768601.1 PREDICTED: arylsulfatase J-like [Acropora digitifera]
MWKHLFLTFLSLHCFCESKSTSQPNIIFIVADDLGWDDVSFHGSNQIPTPNIDQLANSGVILNNYYVSPICSPSRSAIMTGKYPIHTGMQHSVLMAGQPFGLGLQEKLLPQYLKELSYATHGVGKWHLGFYKYDYTPTKRGFDSFFGYWLGAGDYWDHSEQEPDGWGLDLRNNTEPVYNQWGNYRTNLFTDQALDVINSHNTSQPLFLYLAHEAVHSALEHDPLQAPENLIHKFKDTIQDEKRRIFAAMDTALDQSVGKVLAALKAKGMYENSIIVFTTDNGGPANGVSRNTACNYPLRGTKYTLWEGGLRGTAFVHSPLLKSKGRVSMDLMHLSDWVPTLYGCGGGNVSDLIGLDGVDMWPTLSQGLASPRKELVHNIDPVGWAAALRYQNWKLVVNASYGPDRDGWYPPPGFQQNPSRRLNFSNSAALNPSLKSAIVTCPPPPAKPAECGHKDGPCLFNIDKDPCEHTNVANQEKDVLEMMLRLLEKYKKTMVPIRNKPYDHQANPKFHNGLWTAWCDEAPSDKCD